MASSDSARVGERDAGFVPIHRLEIARVDNDPSLPENGRIDFVMRRLVTSMAGRIVAVAARPMFLHDGRTRAGPPFPCLPARHARRFPPPHAVAAVAREHRRRAKRAALPAQQAGDAAPAIRQSPSSTPGRSWPMCSPSIRSASPTKGISARNGASVDPRAAALIGYQLNPGVASSAHLAFHVDDAVGAPASAVVPKAMRVQSVPGQGELPQPFETSEEITARVEWNALKPARCGRRSWRSAASS